jgi:hypothetical protein
MAMNAGELEISIIDILEREHNAINTDEVIGAEIVQTPKEDGTLESTIEFERGTPPFDRTIVVPLARAIAQAVVQHITANAEVGDSGSAGTPAGTWRIS